MEDHTYYKKVHSCDCVVNNLDTDGVNPSRDCSLLACNNRVSPHCNKELSVALTDICAESMPCSATPGLFDVPPQAAEPSAATTPPTKGKKRKRGKTAAEKKQYYREWSKGRIGISEEISRWNALKKSLGIVHSHEVARLLLDSYFTGLANTPTPKTTTTQKQTGISAGAKHLRTRMLAKDYELKTRVTIGAQHERWHQLKKTRHCRTHEEVAKLLLDIFDNVPEDSISQMQSKEDGDHNHNSIVPPVSVSAPSGEEGIHSLEQSTSTPEMVIQRLENSRHHRATGILTEPVASRCHLAFMNCLYTRNVYRQWSTFRDELGFTDDKEFMCWCLTKISSDINGDICTADLHASYVDSEVGESVRASRSHLMSLYGTDTYLKYCDVMRRVGIVSHHRYMKWIIQRVQSVTSQESATTLDEQESADVEEDDKGNILVDVTLNFSNSQNQATLANNKEQDQLPPIDSEDLDQLPPIDNENQPIDSEDQPIDSEDQPIDSEDQPTDSEDQHMDSEDQPIDSKDQHIDSEDQPTDSEDQPTDSEDQPIDSEGQPTDSEDQPTDSEDQPIDSDDQHMDTEGQHIDSGDQPIDSEDQNQLLPRPIDNENQPIELDSENQAWYLLLPITSGYGDQLPRVDSENLDQLPPIDSEDLDQLPPTDSEDKDQTSYRQ